MGRPANILMKGRGVPVIAAIGVVVFLLACYHAIGFTWDDPFISFRYARNLAEGHGLVYNIGERVEGYSNLLYVLICTLVYKLGPGQGDLGLLYFAKLFGLASALGSVYLCWSILKRWELTRAVGYPILAIFGPWMLLTNVFFAGWSMGGMETVFFPFLLMLGSYFLLKEIQGERDPGKLFSLPGFIYGLAAMTRPEGPLLWFAALVAIISIRKQYAISGRLIRGFVLTFLIVMSFFIIHRLIYFGDILPNTYYAKATGGIEQVVAGLYNFTVTRSFAHMGNIIPVLLIFLPLCYPAARRTAGYRLMSFQVAIYFLFIISSGKDWMGGYRFFMHIMPLMVTCAGMGLIAIFSRQEGFYKAGDHRPEFKPMWLFLIGLILLAPPVLLKIVAYAIALDAGKATIEPVQFIIGFIFLGLILILEMSRRIPSGHNRISSTPVALVLVVLLLFNLEATGWRPGSGNGGFLGRSTFEFKSGFSRWPPPMMIEKYLTLGHWMRDHLDRNGLLAIGEAGAIPYFSNQPIVDCFGLMDRQIARMPGATFFDKSNSTEAVKYILGKGPKYILFKGRFTADKKRIIPSWWQFHYIRRIWDNPDFRRDYRFLYEYEDFIIFEHT